MLNINEESLFMVLQLIVGPTVIAALVSGFFSLHLSRRSEKLKYITEERSKWREKIRLISSNIQSGDDKQLQSALVELKLLLNAYGMDESPKQGSIRFEAKYVLMDTHIWVLLFDMEKSILKGENVQEKCNLLLKYLSLLLKYDWERGKREVNRSLYLIYGWTLMIIGSTGLFFSTLFEANIHITIGLITSILFAICLNLIGGTYFESRYRQDLRNRAMDVANGLFKKDGIIIDLYEKLRPSINYKYYSYIHSTFYTKSIILLVIYFIWQRILYKLGILSLENVGMSFIFFLLAYLIGLVLVAIDYKRDITNEYNYLVEVNRLSSSY